MYEDGETAHEVSEAQNLTHINNTLKAKTNVIGCKLDAGTICCIFNSAESGLCCSFNVNFALYKTDAFYKVVPHNELNDIFQPNFGKNLS